MFAETKLKKAGIMKFRDRKERACTAQRASNMTLVGFKLFYKFD